jgi:hypothetical protein
LRSFLGFEYLGTGHREISDQDYESKLLSLVTFLSRSHHLDQHLPDHECKGSGLAFMEKN